MALTATATGTLVLRLANDDGAVTASESSNVTRCDASVDVAFRLSLRVDERSLVSCRPRLGFAGALHGELP